MARCHKALVRWRDLEIVERFEQGLRDGQTAVPAQRSCRQYNLSDRWIWEIVNRPSEPAPQQSTLSTKPGATPGRRLRADPVSAVNPFR
ncbi:hypothetical protein [Pseudomonas aeruginosa]|uniref:hypothetical protein n=1 Tax=Pseudomonas aeruginosa TaxID=287 RepID=UPI000A9981BB|nr:hypothetical protein [Pseudomonas aeruginosa]